MDSLKSGLQGAQVASHGVSILTLTHIFVERLRPILPIFTLFIVHNTMFTMFRPRLRRSFHSLASFSTVSWPMKHTGGQQCVSKERSKLILVRKEREKAAMLTGRSFNSTSKIDSFARILFPLTFTLFNVIYWMHYFKVLASKHHQILIVKFDIFRQRRCSLGRTTGCLGTLNTKEPDFQPLLLLLRKMAFQPLVSSTKNGFSRYRPTMLVFPNQPIF